jgi:6-phosphogluconolactonase
MPLEFEVLAEAGSVAERGRFSFAVSGGHTPWAMFAHLTGKVAWERVTIYQVDERIAPDDDPDRNLTHLTSSLPPGSGADIRPMPVDGQDLEGAGTAYARSLSERFDSIPAGRVETASQLVIADQAAAAGGEVGAR